MNVPFFTPKAAASTLVGVGSMGGGGGAVYLYQMPKNWKDLLIKEGYVFLSTDEDYKGMFNDRKEDEGWKNESDLSGATDSDVKSKASGYCNKKFKEALPSSSDEKYSSTKQNLISFCTTEGIQTVKARLIQSKKKDWINESNDEEKWKVVFAVYRYNEDFIKWLKEDNTANSSLDKTSKPSEHHEKLKNACINLLKKSYREIKDDRYFNYGAWWCVDPGYTTIKEKIKKEDSTWEEKQQNDEDWNDLKTKWEKTEQVKTWAHKAKNNGSDNGEAGELDETGLKALCNDDDKGIKSKLSEDDNYQEKYLVIKVVCKKTNSDS